MRDRAGPRRAVGILLAAGAGSRFDGDTHKLLAPLPATADRPPEPVVGRSLAAALGAVEVGALDDLVVVTGAADLSAVLAGAGSSRVHVVHHAGWADGQATSIAAGLQVASELSADVAVIGLGDQPDVTPATWVAVASAARAPDARPIAVATYDGRPRNPVALHRSVWHRLPTTGDEGARALVRVSSDQVTPVPSAGSPDDIDTVEDHRRWLNS